MITFDQYLLRQPSAPESSESDKFYFGVCQRLAEVAKERNLFPSYPEKVIERAALILIGYYQDVISDAGVWRAFISECRTLYGAPVPFYTTADSDYFDFELNKADVQFITWYALSMNYENRRVCYPLDKEILGGANEWFNVLEAVYDEAPIPTDYRMAQELEIHSEEDRPAIMKLANWLFLHCYLMTPAYALTLSEMASEFDLSTEDGVLEMQKKLDASMWQDPTGPLALFLGEWLYLIIEGKEAPLPKEDTSEKALHPYYEKFTQYTAGKTIQFFSDYQELNNFFIKALGWNESEEHLPQVKGDVDFVLMVDPVKGMLMARNVAKCIACPDNPYYDKDYAMQHAITILTERGVCPPDLLHVVCKNGWLPDAVFPESIDHELVKQNWDFIARCYLQQYYRGD